MSGVTTAKRYAHALYDVAAEKHMIDTVAEDLATIDNMMSRAAPLKDYCLRRHTDRLVEMDFVMRAFVPFISPLTARVITLAVHNGRLAVVPHLFNAFTEIKNRNAGIVDVLVESPQVADMHTLETIKEKMRKYAGEHAVIRNAPVPGLLGGVRIIWNNRMIDLSIAGRLRKMRLLIKEH